MFPNSLSKECFSFVSRQCDSAASFRNQQEKFVNLKVDNRTGIATLELNRPPVNSLNTALLKDISDALDEVTKNHSKGLILTSASTKVFSAGLDLTNIYKPNPVELKELWRTLQDIWLKLYGSTFPTAAAINGHSPAGGCLLALACEYRVMCPNYTIGFNETQLGLIPPSWCQASMRNAMSIRDTEMALTLGKMFTTDEALKVRLIDEIAVDKTDALNRCEKFLLQFANVSPDARAQTKLNCRGKDLAELANHRDDDFEKFLFSLEQPSVQDAMKSYIEKLGSKRST